MDYIVVLEDDTVGLLEGSTLVSDVEDCIGIEVAISMRDENGAEYDIIVGVLKEILEEVE